jgi:putative endonuclease
LYFKFLAGILEIIRARSFQPEADPPLAEVGPQKFMFTVYVLRSERNNKRYIGYTTKSARGRLSEHNSGASKFTRQNRPFKLIYTEQYTDKTEAIKREKFLKSGQGRKFLDKIGPVA